MRRHDAGFTLVEVTVAFAIVAVTLAAIYPSIGSAYRGYARVQLREQALAHARTQLDAIGIEAPLAAGESTGIYSSGTAWRLVVEPIEITAYKGRAFRILLEAQDHGGRPLLRLETIKLGPAAIHE